MIIAGVGQTENIDTQAAISTVIEQCRQKLAGRLPQAGIVFAGVDFDHRLMLDEIHAQFPGIKIIGCTTSGDFSSGYGSSDDSISLMVFYSDDIEFGVGVGRSLSENPVAVAQSAIEQASRNLTKQASICLALPDGFNKSFDSIMKTLNRALGHNCPIFGGAAGTQWDADIMPLQFYEDEILEDAIPIMILAGPIEYTFSIANSWRPVGKQARITQAEGRLVQRIDDFKAVDFYRHYLGDHSEPAREFVLAVHDKDSEQRYLRAPIEYNPDGSIIFTESIPQGATVQLTEAIREVIIEDTKTTSQELFQQIPEMEPAFAMAFSCAFRKSVLGTRVDEELQILQTNLPPGLPIMGFYSFGEIAPLVKGQDSFFHGATLVTLLVGQTNGAAAAIDESGEAGLSADKPEPLEKTGPDADRDMEDLRLENRLLKRKLARSESYRGRLEEIKDFNSTMHRKIIEEVEEAREEIQRKESQLRKSEEKYRRIVTTAGEGFILMDEEMIITDANEAFCRMVNLSREELLGKTPFDFGGEVFRQFSSTGAGNLSPREYLKIEGLLKANTMTGIPVLIHGSKLRDDSGHIIGNMAFVADLTEQKKALALAAEVQKSLLPQYGVNLPGLDVAGRNVSCDEIGGDYFDFLDQNDYPNAPLSIVVGDIAGHGVDAALLMTSARAFLRMRASQSGNISEIITEMNRHLTSDILESGRFMTLFYLAIDPDNQRLQWVRAGHDPALIYDPERNTFEELSGEGIALGVSEDVRYEENVKSGVAEGQVIALGTDGIWEAINRDGQMFGKERFRDVIRSHAKENAITILSAVYDELDHYTRGQKSADDITLVVAKVSNDHPTAGSYQI
jgi:PAS domain S-box-containing protein